jgi:hypothetical protein
MKIKSVLGALALIATSVFISVVPAQAGECSAEDPCHTYAMVNDAGVVTNIIVCQPSVCGSGVWAGSRVVLQVVANPDTHLNQGGIFGGTDNKDKIVTESNGTFTITNNNPVIKQEVIKETPNSGVQLEAKIGPGTQQSFTVADTAHTAGQITLHDEAIKQNVSATLTASEVNIETSTVVISTVEKSIEIQPGIVIDTTLTSTRTVETITPVVTESITFTERQTQASVEAAVENMPIIKRQIIWFMGRLSVWFI